MTVDRKAQKRIAEALMASGTLQFPDIHAAGDGPYFAIDFAKLWSSVAPREVVVPFYRWMLEEVIGRTVDLSAGVSYYGTCFGSSLIIDSGLPMITPREPKTHGDPTSIDGAYQAGQRVLLIADQAAEFESFARAMAILKTAELVAPHAVVLIDHDTGVSELLAGEGCELHAITNVWQLFRACAETGKITRYHADFLIRSQQNRSA